MNTDHIGFAGMGMIQNSFTPLWFFPLLALLVIWAFFWKAMALWHSARRGHPWWFVVILILNTFGILEIIYLFGVAKVTLHNLLRFKK